MNGFVVLAADLLVGILLVATIISSVRLSRRITRLKTDEAAMRIVVAELVSATDGAERAVAGLRAALAECDRDLADHMAMARRQTQDLGLAVAAGEKVMGGLERVFDTTRRVVEANPLPSAVEPVETRATGALQSALAAAQALADRGARRVERQAA